MQSIQEITRASRKQNGHARQQETYIACTNPWLLEVLCNTGNTCTTLTQADAAAQEPDMCTCCLPCPLQPSVTNMASGSQQESAHHTASSHLGAYWAVPPTKTAAEMAMQRWPAAPKAAPARAAVVASGKASGSTTAWFLAPALACTARLARQAGSCCSVDRWLELNS